MRALLLAAVLALPAHAAPFLVMDVQPEADRCTITGLPAPVPASVDEAAGLCKWDWRAFPWAATPLRRRPATYGGRRHRAPLLPSRGRN